jgi:cytochrome c peroxidase
VTRALGVVAVALLLCGSLRGLAQEVRPVRLTPVPGLDEAMRIPEDNPITIAAVELGRALFFDARLSADGTVSCASCHRPEQRFADTARTSPGVGGRTGKRNAPVLINRGYGSFFSWDGRNQRLELQVLRPFLDPRELNLPLDSVVNRLVAEDDYRRGFALAFGGEITGPRVAMALATYVRTIRSGGSPVDRYRAGDLSALTPEARRGGELFAGRANCIACHRSANFTDEGLHNTGVAVRSGDPGRFAVTGHPDDRGVFRTPTLRDIARTAPYMHDGSLGTLEEVLEFYDGGGVPNPNLSRELRPLKLAASEKADLLAFLRALSADSVTCAPFSCTDAGAGRKQPQR